MQKQIVKLFTSGLILAGIFYAGKQYMEPPRDEVVKASMAPTAILKPSVIQSEIPKVISGKTDNMLSSAESCLGETLELASVGEFDVFLKRQELSSQVWNWDNYFIETPDGEKRTIHVVTDQNKNGTEVKVLKVFREDSDGPTLLEEASFNEEAEFEAELLKKQKMGVLTSKQTVDTLSSNKGLEIKRTVLDGVITDLSLRSSKGVLDCRNSDAVLSCSCK